jgi:hypothetical protein
MDEPIRGVYGARRPAIIALMTSGVAVGSRKSTEYRSPSSKLSRAIRSSSETVATAVPADLTQIAESHESS